MKKLYFSVLVTFLGLGAARAQFLIPGNHNPLIGDIYKTRQCDSTAINPGPGGAGVVWTFTNLAIRTPTVSSTVTAVPSSVTATFPSASIAITPDGSNNSFYTPTSTDYKYWGGNIIVQSYNVLLNYTQPAILASYPVAYSNTLSTNVSGSMSMTSPLNASGNFSGVASYTADGTGMLQLPGPKTFSNVIRVNTVQALTFTVTMPFAVNGTITQVSYDYYATLSSSKPPILSITQTTVHATIGTDQLQTYVRVNADYPSMGVNELSKAVSGLEVYPNPSSDGVYVSFVNESAEPASCEISNALGQAVRKSDLGISKGSVKYYVNTEGLVAGIYFVKVHVGDKTGVEKITVQ